MTTPEKNKLEQCLQVSLAILVGIYFLDVAFPRLVQKKMN